MKRHILFMIMLIITTLSFSQSQKSKNKYIEYSDWSKLKKHQIPEWFKDAKFGIYAHLGVYCVPAFSSEWYPHNMYSLDRKTGEPTKEMNHQIKTYGSLKTFGYKDFVPMFKAEKFNASTWADLYKEAGAKFGGIVTEHHDGFAMWDSKVNPWNAVSKGPHKNLYGDMVKELRKRNIKILATFHHAQNYNGYFPKKDIGDLNNPEAKYLYGRISQEEGDNRWFAQIKEVIDEYKPDQIWFDFDLAHVSDQMKNKFATYYYNKEKEWNKQLIITRKYEQLPIGVGALDVERGGREKIYKDLWQTDDAVAVNSWCWVNGLKLKPTNELIHELIDIVSKNGVLLLNICPKADGTIPEDQQKQLKDIGKFFKINGEAIYGSRPYKTLGEGPNVSNRGRGLRRHDAPANFSSKDIRFTQSKDGKTIYIFALGWPQKQLEINSLSEEISNKKIKNIYLLGGEKASWKTTNSKLIINTSKEIAPKNQYAFVWKVNLK